MGKLKAWINPRCCNTARPTCANGCPSVTDDARNTSKSFHDSNLSMTRCTGLSKVTFIASLAETRLARCAPITFDFEQVGERDGKTARERDGQGRETECGRDGDMWGG